MASILLVLKLPHPCWQLNVFLSIAGSVKVCRNILAITLLLWIPLPVKRVYPSDLDGFIVLKAFATSSTLKHSPVVQEIDLQVWRFPHFVCVWLTIDVVPKFEIVHRRWLEVNGYLLSYDLWFVVFEMSGFLVRRRQVKPSSSLCSLVIYHYSCWCFASCSSRSCSRNLDLCQSLSLVPARLSV